MAPMVLCHVFFLMIKSLHLVAWYVLYLCHSGKYIPPHQRGSGRLQTSDSWADSDSGSSYRGAGQGKFI